MPDTKITVEPNHYIVLFKGNRTDYYIDRNHLALDECDWVLVQAERGKDIGQIKSLIRKQDFEIYSQHKYPLEILRKAESIEIEQVKKLHEMEEEVLATCQELVNFRGLMMKLVDAEYQFDCNKLTIYFTADDRVDFRELVKDLAATYRTRIELRQIGVRDEVKRIGGIGPCGLPTCCSQFLRKFDPISTQMARVQNLAVNPSKISGQCERLMCCLAYENEHYEKMLTQFPNPGQTYDTRDGMKWLVESIDYFHDKILIKNLKDEEFSTMTLIEFKKNLAERDEMLKKWAGKNTGMSSPGNTKNG